jgi:broad specificity phosphatase PhoE
MSRLTSVVIDVEQEVVPTLVVSHVSILQCLMAYFRNTRVEQCMSIEVPLHTVIKFTPVRGGGWSESHHPFYDVPLEGDLEKRQSHSVGILNTHMDVDQSNHSESCSSLPIWGDNTMSPRPPLAKRISH